MKARSSSIHTDTQQRDAAARQIQSAGGLQRQALQSPLPMQSTGTLKSWNDDRGFGFIEPTHGGQEIFVHIKAFAAATRNF